MILFIHHGTILLVTRFVRLYYQRFSYSRFSNNKIISQSSIIQFPSKEAGSDNGTIQSSTSCLDHHQVTIDCGNLSFASHVFGRSSFSCSLFWHAIFPIFPSRSAGSRSCSLAPDKADDEFGALFDRWVGDFSWLGKKAGR